MITGAQSVEGYIVSQSFLIFNTLFSGILTGSILMHEKFFDIFPVHKAGKKYRKKNINAPRLCADDIMSKERFTQMQNIYAQAMGKFGLVRGKEGSEARHISTQQYYLFPMMKEQLRVADFCKTMGLAINSIRALLEGRNLTAKTFLSFRRNTGRSLQRRMSS
jgi:hypothetical protein